MIPDPEDIRALRRDKYEDDPAADMEADLARLSSGEPLAYVIGWQPFLGLKVWLDSRPLIPRPETEWWTELLIQDLRARFGEKPFSFLDLCAGSGAIGLSVLKHLPNAEVAFAELIPAHAKTIRKNIVENGLDAKRAEICTGDLFDALTLGQELARFDCIAANPPYVPHERDLPEEVADFEPAEALYAGPDGLALIRRIAHDAPKHLRPGGSLWMECDSDHAECGRLLLLACGARSAELHTDLYGRPRLLVSYYD